MPSAFWVPKVERIGQEIAAEALRLAELPDTGARHSAGPATWRYSRHKRWLIFYQPHPQGIEVMRVIDGARDLPRVLVERFE